MCAYQWCDKGAVVQYVALTDTHLAKLLRAASPRVCVFVRVCESLLCPIGPTPHQYITHVSNINTWYTVEIRQLMKWQKGV